MQQMMPMQDMIDSMKCQRRPFFAVLVIACLSLLGCESFPESSFELARDSRLPKWFTLPAGLSRSDVTVTASYYVKPSGREAVFVLKDTQQKKLAEVQGTQQGLKPRTLKSSQPSYPLYEVITVNGITEIIEHRQMEPTFYITDDPSVWSELGVSQR